MFSLESELSEEDFLEAAMLAENGLERCNTGPPIKDSSSSENNSCKTTDRGILSEIQPITLRELPSARSENPDVPGAAGVSVPDVTLNAATNSDVVASNQHLDAATIFCLSQEDFDEESDVFQFDQNPVEPAVPTHIDTADRLHSITGSLLTAASSTAVVSHVGLRETTTLPVSSSDSLPKNALRQLPANVDYSRIQQRLVSSTDLKHQTFGISSASHLQQTSATALRHTSQRLSMASDNLPFSTISESCTSQSLSAVSSNFVQTPTSHVAHQPANLLPQSVYRPSVDDGRSGTPTPVRRKRKFPGPAGVLPKLKPGSNLDEVTLPCGDSKPSLPTETLPAAASDVVLSQSSDDHFTSDAWRSMVSDLDPHSERILDQFSIQAIIQMANSRQLPRGKVPVVGAVIESVTTRGADASVTLRDTTGSISGTVHRELVKEYVGHIQPGTVLVLRQVSVLRPLGRNCYLNITPNNLVRLYSQADAVESGRCTSIKIRDLTPEDLAVTPYQSPGPTTHTLRARSSAPLMGNNLQIRQSCTNAATPSSMSGTKSRQPFQTGPQNTVAKSSVGTVLRPVPQTGPTWSSSISQGSSPCNRPTMLTPVRSTPSVLVTNMNRRNLADPPQLSTPHPLTQRFSSAPSCTSQPPSSCQSQISHGGSASATKKFQFKRTSTMPASPSVQTSQTSLRRSSLPEETRAGVDVLPHPGVKSSTSNLENVPQSATNDCNSSDLWQTDAVDDEVLFNLSSEFLADF